MCLGITVYLFRLQTPLSNRGMHIPLHYDLSYQNLPQLYDASPKRILFLQCSLVITSLAYNFPQSHRSLT